MEENTLCGIYEPSAVTGKNATFYRIFYLCQSHFIGRLMHLIV